VLEAFALWNDLSTSTINLIIDQTLLDVDVNIDNFDTYLPSVDDSEFHADDNLNPVVYDSNGEIIDEFFGGGANEIIIGFAASVYTYRSSYFDEGYAVINGKDLGLTTTTFKLLIAHEIAHFFGLDHTQVNISNQETEYGYPAFCSTDSRDNYPVMYPFVCRNVETLHSDDISAVTALYPTTDINDNFGILEGRFVDESGYPILGANIWVENTVSGETYSIVSDYLKQGTGYYKLYLPAGTYTLHANSINPEFNGGSGIGPYASTIYDISFVDPHPITPVTYQGDSEGSDEIITISVNQSLIINFSSSGGIAVFPADDSSDDDSFADLFGATSHVTLLLLLGVIVVVRRIGQPGISFSE
jgi:predicted Zn-dependent protease with MMP-like domain